MLIYATCSYSAEEDEEIVNWLVGQFNAQIISLVMDSDWGIVASGGGYRFWPYKVKGEGFFLACMQKVNGEEDVAIKVKKKPEPLTKKEREIVVNWVKESELDFITNKQIVYAWPEKLVTDFSWLLQELRLLYSGTVAGELIRDKFIPDHALAMSSITADSVGRIALEYDQAIKYLQRKELTTATNARGWQLMQYAGYSLGWANVLPNRINNYYPKELRILKER